MIRFCIEIKIDMCGLSGIISLTGINVQAFETMHNEIANRGPDKSGTIVCPYAALGMHRLRIRGKDEQVPFFAEQEYYVAFNGQIYSQFHVTNMQYIDVEDSLNNEVDVVLSDNEISYSEWYVFLCKTRFKSI